MNKPVRNDLSLKLLMLSFCVAMFSLNVSADTEMSAREIMERVDEESRKSTDSAFTRMKLTTCKYGKKDGKIKCAEKPRVKLVENAQINTGVDDRIPRVSQSFLSQPVREALECSLTAMMIVTEIMRPGSICLRLER